MKEGFDNEAFTPKLEEFSERRFKGTEVSGSIEKFLLQPLSEARLYSDYQYELGETGNGKAVWALLIIAVFIISIAWINYINLSTARAMDRAREVGVRKVLGAVKKQLIFQFLTEAFVFNLLALFIAFTLIQIFQPLYNSFTGVELSLISITALGPSVLSSLGIGLMILLIGVLLSGFYPAFVLSSYNPVNVLKGQFKTSLKGIGLRRSLVVFSICLFHRFDCLCDHCFSAGQLYE